MTIATTKPKQPRPAQHVITLHVARDENLVWWRRFRRACQCVMATLIVLMLACILGVFLLRRYSATRGRLICGNLDEKGNLHRIMAQNPGFPCEKFADEEHEMVFEKGAILATTPRPNFDTNTIWHKIDWWFMHDFVANISAVRYGGKCFVKRPEIPTPAGYQKLMLDSAKSYVESYQISALIYYKVIEPSLTVSDVWDLNSVWITNDCEDTQVFMMETELYGVRKNRFRRGTRESEIDAGSLRGLQGNSAENAPNPQNPQAASQNPGSLHRSQDLPQNPDNLESAEETGLQSEHKVVPKKGVAVQDSQLTIVQDTAARLSVFIVREQQRCYVQDFDDTLETHLYHWTGELLSSYRINPETLSSQELEALNSVILRERCSDFEVHRVQKKRETRRKRKSHRKV